MKLNGTAPLVDDLIHRAQENPIVWKESEKTALVDIFTQMKKIVEQGDDEFRSIWIEVDRGKIEDFGSFDEYVDEGMVTDYEEFIEIWECYYPGETKWYEFSVSAYNSEIYFYFDSKLTFHVKLKEASEPINYSNLQLINWLKDKVNFDINRLKTDPLKYNRYIKTNLSYQKRFGKILRSEYWKICPDEKNRFNTNISEKDISTLAEICKQSLNLEENLLIKKMTAGDFFNFCRIGYFANGYYKDKNKNPSAREMYLAFADGRDCGLTGLDQRSEADFYHWHLNDSHCGGHPWEIFKGGNSTHISLYVMKVTNGWLLRLKGSSPVRVIETVKMAIALYNSRVPFKLEECEEIYRMVTGKDFIGIVPETIIPRYCHSLFPKKDKIIDFMNLEFEYSNEIIKLAHWYPISELRLEG